MITRSQVTPRPVRIGPATLTVTLVDASGKPMKAAHVVLEGTMTHPGMRPTFAEAVEIGAGVYAATLRFSMAGDWVVLLHVSAPDGQQFDRELPKIDVHTS